MRPELRRCGSQRYDRHATLLVAVMMVVPDYRGFRIEVDAVAADGRWNADVRIRRILSQDKPHVDRVTCLKLTAEHAERAAEIWAQRWIDLQLNDGPAPARQ
jgi:hypothetical protein